MLYGQREVFMSKHVSADQKLHSIDTKLIKRLPKSRLRHQSHEPSGPPAGTNSKNQFR